jgi:hypothetical protein
LSVALKDTAFAGAKTFDVDTHTMRFHLGYDDGVREITGAYALGDTDWTVTEFTFYRPNTQVTLAFDEARRLMSIDSSDGISWKRPADRALDISPAPTGDNPYFAANADILEVARAMDASASSSAATAAQPAPAYSPGSTPTAITEPKSSASQALALSFALGTAAVIFAPLLGVLSPMVAMFGVTLLFEELWGNRFDGTWLATNSGSTLVVTIENGRITSIYDQKNGQGYEIVDNPRGTKSGDRIEWEVLVNVLGQQAQVEFQFDMQEQADGSLTGTLTALGSSFSRVPITMVRS